MANGISMCIGLIIITNTIYAKLDCHFIYYCNENNYRTRLNAALEMIIHLFSIKPHFLKCDEKRKKHSSYEQNITLSGPIEVTRGHMSDYKLFKKPKRKLLKKIL